MRRLFVCSLMLLALAACGPSPETIQTAAAQTQAVNTAAAVAQAQTATAAAPTATASPSATFTATASPLPSETPTETTTPTDTPTPQPSATPTNTAEPAASPTNTRPPVTLAPPTATVPPTQPGPDFVTTVKAIREQVKNIGWQIDLAVNSGVLDCQQVIDGYMYFRDRRGLTAPGGMEQAQATYQAAFAQFHDRVWNLWAICNTNLTMPYFAQPIGPMHWAVARMGIDEVVPLLDQAIREAGGTP